MLNFYHVIGLTPGKEIQERDNILDVDITYAMQRRAMHNDTEILAAQQAGKSIWASGGGTYLLNDQYLLIVQRPLEAKVNPGKFSLFTGRADGGDELVQPGLLIRELFEELILYAGPRLYKPVCEEFQKTIDQIYVKLSKALNLDLEDVEPLPLKSLKIAPRHVRVTNGGRCFKSSLDYHMNQHKEINFLFVLAAKIDIENLVGRDGEYHLENAKKIEHKRSIYLYDLHTSAGRNISMTGHRQEQVTINRDLMTEHLRYLVDSCIKR